MGAMKCQEFTASGTFNVPAGVSCIIVTMIGGGGPGGYASNASPGTTGYFGGSTGEFGTWRMLPCTPGGTVAITVGAGGLGTATADTDGSPSNVGPMFAVGGLRGSTGGTNGPNGGGLNGGTSLSAVPGNLGSGPIVNGLNTSRNQPWMTAGSANAFPRSIAGVNGSPGSPSASYTTGAPGGPGGTNGGGNGGNSTLYGIGGTGGDGTPAHGGMGSVGIGYGSGSGGDSGTSTTQTDGPNGANGYVLVQWIG